MTYFGWDLPPGVTDRMIDDAFGGGVCPVCEDEACEGRMPKNKMRPPRLWHEQEILDEDEPQPTMVDIQRAIR